MFKKLTLSVALVIVVTSLGCVCNPGGHFGMGFNNPCGPCAPSYECSPCGMSACDPAPCGPCEQATFACEPAACVPSACDATACEPCGAAACGNACSYNSCGCTIGFGIKPSFGLGHGNPARFGQGNFQRPQEDMYVTRGPRDFFYSPR